MTNQRRILDDNAPENRRSEAQRPIELIKQVRAAFKNYDAATMGRVFDVKVLNNRAILGAAGNNDYARPHHRDFLSA